MEEKNIFDLSKIIELTKITGDKIADYTIQAHHIQKEQISSEHLKDKIILPKHISDKAVETQHLSDAVMSLLGSGIKISSSYNGSVQLSSTTSTIVSLSLNISKSTDVLLIGYGMLYAFVSSPTAGTIYGMMGNIYIDSNSVIGATFSQEAWSSTYFFAYMPYIFVTVASLQAGTRMIELKGSSLNNPTSCSANNNILVAIYGG